MSQIEQPQFTTDVMHAINRDIFGFVVPYAASDGITLNVENILEPNVLSIEPIIFQTVRGGFDRVTLGLNPEGELTPDLLLSLPTEAQGVYLETSPQRLRFVHSSIKHDRRNGNTTGEYLRINMLPETENGILIWSATGNITVSRDGSSKVEETRTPVLDDSLSNIFRPIRTKFYETINSKPSSYPLT